MNWSPISRVLTDNQFAFNVMAIKMVWTLGKSKEDLLSLDVTVAEFIGDMTKALGVLPIEIIVGTKTSTTTFFVVDSIASYRALLCRDWIHVMK